MSFSRRMWNEIDPIYQAVLAHPFNLEMSNGRLDRDVFLFYMIQDAHYLGVFARALALAAAKAPMAAAQIRLADCAADAIRVERGLHASFFKSFGVSQALFEATPPSPTCEAYGNFLLARAHGPGYGVAVAAVLPCFKIYYEVGQVLFGQSSSSNPFREWIDTYADEAFGRTVRDIESLADQAFVEASARERLEMDHAYLTASRYEWLFWDKAYSREAWPV
ncbi:thiaminase (transcriptional activator TenA) [Arboricoccus pini]|uniref:Thiaminase (Transcriptional activator TenA) n=1 Tax=Arboricoccus pini TaxID=1963835 RepID=A0A212RC68_9PROT|nr:TenA family protein [Arboricoccus pini]SNB69791.1 thiaminase (transcriptional activator TenA) [Arboricoccus pini]